MQIRQLTVIAMCTIWSVIAERSKLDGIAAIVGDSIILESELNAYTLLRLNEMKVSPAEVNIDSLNRLYLQELIDGKVLLVHAEKDTNIQISPEEIDDALDRQVNGIMLQNRLTQEQLEEELRKSNNMSLSEFKEQMRKGIREQLIKQKVQQYYFARTQLSRSDVEEFYAEYQDSLPKAGRSTHISQLTIQMSPSDSIRQEAFEKITNIKRKLDAGKDFIELTSFSEGPNAANGGDLGYIAKGSTGFIKFEEAAFSLKPGETSDIFETKLGFHIVKVEDKKDQQVHVRQILIKIGPQEQEVVRIKSLLDSIATHAQSRQDFEMAVVRHCTDEQLVSRKGNMGWLSVYQAAALAGPEIDSLPAGTVTRPRKQGAAYVIFRINDRVTEREYTLEDDWELLAEKAKEIFAQKQLIKLVDKWRKSVFIDIRT
ncbi:MAG: hypothetical protein GF398_14210 [Chitinivibrionales bacterium]|nr:hypothetical protein [Chitinivibrionales bacterium]